MRDGDRLAAVYFRGCSRQEFQAALKALWSREPDAYFDDEIRRWRFEARRVGLVADALRQAGLEVRYHNTGCEAFDVFATVRRLAKRQGDA